MSQKIYTFGDGKAEGNAQMRNLLGGKGANLAEMNLLGMPVPPGFTITTEVCTEYTQYGRYKVVEDIKTDVEKAIAHVEKLTGNKFDDPKNPLLVSVRSGARASMPGMMDTVLNLGMNDATVATMAEKSGNPRFAWDSYRRFVQMYGDVVLGMKPQSKTDIDPFEAIMDKVKEEKGVKFDNELDVDDLKELVVRFKAAVKEYTGKDFPESAWEQLWGGICAVFDSWMNERAIIYRRMNQIPEEWGTAVNVQAMVYGNMGDNSATGVAFSRDAATGENIFNGEYLINAQGEDVVAGVRTPQQITVEGSRRWAALQGISEEERASKYPSLEESMPVCAAELIAIAHRLEDYYKDMQDMEFTIENNKLYMLQTRSGKRTAQAAVKIAVDMVREGMIDKKTAVTRIEPQQIDQLLHPTFDPAELAAAQVIAKGLAASPGAGCGRLCFTAEEAAAAAAKGQKVLLAREETSPEDLAGMVIAEGILTARGGMTSHAAVVARGMGKCCVAGCSSIRVNEGARVLTTADGKEYRAGDYLSINGSTGEVYEGRIRTKTPTLSGDFETIMEWADELRELKIRANADNPRDARQALDFGAEGIGLCRTEHMFFDEARIPAIRRMILADTPEEELEALEVIRPLQQQDFKEIFLEMGDRPVTIRLLDPPLHEFLPQTQEEIAEVAALMGVSAKKIAAKVTELHEINPMLGNRGCRLAVTSPAIAVMQTEAIIGAALEVKKETGAELVPEIMIPLVNSEAELKYVKHIVTRTAEDCIRESGISLDYLIGTMVETPRAALTADEIAKDAEFFSFGTNDLTQMTFGLSRDDTGKMIETYMQKDILEADPFRTLDTVGVGKLLEMAVKLGRQTRPKLKLGICGEHGGDPKTIAFCHRIGLHYVSCSPFRVPIARLAAAQAAVRAEEAQGE